jgi:L-lactate utilization protein LutB
MNNEKIEELKKQIMELKKQWPKHSVPPAMLQQLDDLEEQLEHELRKSHNENSTSVTLE